MFWGITNSIENSKHSRECGYFLHPSRRLVQFSLHNFCCKFLPGRFTQAEVDCQLAVSDFCCGVNLLRKLSQFSLINYRRGEISLFSIGILFKVFLTWSHAVRRCITYIVLNSLSSYLPITRESLCGGCCSCINVNKLSFPSIFVVNW